MSVNGFKLSDGSVEKYNYDSLDNKPDLSNYVTNTDYASANDAGVVKLSDDFEISNNGVVSAFRATSSHAGVASIATAQAIKNGLSAYTIIAPNQQHISTFYGLAKAAGDNTQSQSNNAVGTYTPQAKEAIQTMLGVNYYIVNVTLTGEAGGYTDKTIGEIYAAFNSGQKVIFTGYVDDMEFKVPLTSIYITTNQQDGFESYCIQASCVMMGNTHYQITLMMESQDTDSTIVWLNQDIIGEDNLNVYITMETDNTGTSDVSIEDILVAYRDHKRVLFNGTFFGLDVTIPLTTIFAVEDEYGNTQYGISAFTTYFDSNGSYLVTLVMEPGSIDTVNLFQNQIDQPDLSDYVQKTDYASVNDAGVVKVSGHGLQMTNGRIDILSAQDSQIKSGADTLSPITPLKQHDSVFYGLAKAAGDTTQAQSNNAAGTYTDNAKTAIKSMLGVETVVNVSGTTPTITANQNTRYICGEVVSISFTPCASGLCDVRFTSGSTPTVLTLPNTVKMPSWWDGTCEANTVYEINVLDGVYGGVMTWEV